MGISSILRRANGRTKRNIGRSYTGLRPGMGIKAVEEQRGRPQAAVLREYIDRGSMKRQREGV